jgi:hypothetical protein
MIFVIDTITEYHSWQTAIEPYVVHTTKIEKAFEFQSKIGQGSFGSVYKAAYINNSSNPLS